MKKLGQIRPLRLELSLVRCPHCGNSLLNLVLGCIYPIANIQCGECFSVFWLVWPSKDKWPVQHDGAIYATKTTKLCKTEKEFRKVAKEMGAI